MLGLSPGKCLSDLKVIVVNHYLQGDNSMEMPFFLLFGVSKLHNEVGSEQL